LKPRATRPLLFPFYIPTLIYNEEYDKAEKYLQIVETAENEALRTKLMCLVWTTRSIIAAARCQPEKAEEYSHKAMASLLPDDIKQRAVVMQSRVRFTGLHGDTKEIEKVLREALPAYREADHVIFQVWGKILLGLLRLLQGRLRESAEELEGAQQFDELE